MKYKKMLALSLCIVMSMSCVSCVREGYDSSNYEISQEDTSEDESVQNVYSNYDAVDMEGRTIKIGIWWDEYWDSEYKSFEDITLAGGTIDSEEIMQMKLDAVRAVEEKWNCKIDFVNLGWDGIIESINTTIPAGTPECDIYLTDLQFGLDAVADGYAQKLSEICPYGDVNNSQMVFTKNGYLGYDDYFFACSTSAPSGAMYLAYNADMLDSLGLEYPEDLAARGEWTWDVFNEYIEKLTVDADGDGTTDVYGFGTAYTLAISGFAASNNCVIAGDITEGLSDNSSIEVFDQLYKMYVEDGTARPINDDDWNDNLFAVTNGKAAFGFTQPWILIQEKENHDFEVRICPAPTGPSGDDSMSPIQIVNNYFIPVGVEDATYVYEIFEELNNWYLGDTQIRDDSEWFESAFTDKAQIALATEIGNKSNNDIWTIIDDAGAVSDVFYSTCVNKKRTVSDAIEENADLLQEELDNYLSTAD